MLNLLGLVVVLDPVWALARHLPGLVWPPAPCLVGAAKLNVALLAEENFPPRYVWRGAAAFGPGAAGLIWVLYRRRTRRHAG